MAQKIRKRLWPHVYKRAHPSGQIAFVVDLGKVDGKRQRFSFKDRSSAETFAEHKRIERSNEGTSALALTQETRTDAAKAAKLLQEHGVTMEEAAKYYLKHVVAYRNGPSVGTIIEQMLAEARQNNRRDRTIQDLKNRFQMFSNDFGTAKLSATSFEELKEWFMDSEEWSPRTKINYLTKISQLYNYALKHGWVDSNLIERIDRPDTEEKEPGIFTVSQAFNLLKHANEFGLLAYVSLGFFAGLRSAEMRRLKGEAINLEEKQIVIGADVAKKRSRRVVSISDNLGAWLKKITVLEGPIIKTKTFVEDMDSVRAAAGIETWPHNGLRHSFGSYHLAQFGDGNKTAMQMGHRDQNVVHNHYKALVLRGEAEKYWNLRPD